MIIACILVYVACAIAAGYAWGLLSPIANSIDRSIAGFFVIVSGPFGLTFSLGLLAREVAGRHREIGGARHRLALAELEQQEREIAKLLGGEVRR